MKTTTNQRNIQSFFDRLSSAPALKGVQELNEALARGDSALGTQDHLHPTKEGKRNILKHMYIEDSITDMGTGEAQTSVNMGR